MCLKKEVSVLFLHDFLLKCESSRLLTLQVSAVKPRPAAALFWLICTVWNVPQRQPLFRERLPSRRPRGSARSRHREAEKKQQHSNGGTLPRGKCAFKITSLPTKHGGCIKIRRMDEHTCSTKETGLTVVLPFPFRCKPLSKSGEDTRLWSEDGPGEPEAEETRTAQSKESARNPVKTVHPVRQSFICCT